MNSRRTLTKGQVHFFARRLLAGEPIPLFVRRADNMAIEAAVTRIRRRRTYRHRRDVLDPNQIKRP